MKTLKEQLNQSNVTHYRKLTLEDVEDFLKTIFTNKLPKLQPSQYTYMGELGKIQFNIFIKNHPNKKIINRLFKMYNRYKNIEQLHLIKLHHIKVGYSTVDIKELSIRAKLLDDKVVKITNKIRKLYYGNTN